MAEQKEYMHKVEMTQEDIKTTSIYVAEALLKCCEEKDMLPDQAYMGFLYGMGRLAKSMGWIMDFQKSVDETIRPFAEGFRDEGIMEEIYESKGKKD